MQHGDYISLRTRDEFLALLKETGKGDLELTNLIPKTAFLPVAQLKRWVQAGIAESALYGVRVEKRPKKGMGGRRPQATCPTCGEKFDSKYGRVYDLDECRPSHLARAVKLTKKLRSEDKPVKGRRRRRCKAPNCTALFYPKEKRQGYHTPDCAARVRAAKYRQRPTPLDTVTVTATA